MGQRQRPKPEHLASKLLAIRQTLHASQSQLAKLMGLTAARISEYERGLREPSLSVLLQYARLAGVSTDLLIDDEMQIVIAPS